MFDYTKRVATRIRDVQDRPIELQYLEEDASRKSRSSTKTTGRTLPPYPYHWYSDRKAFERDIEWFHNQTIDVLGQHSSIPSTPLDFLNSSPPLRSHTSTLTKTMAEPFTDVQERMMDAMVARITAALQQNNPPTPPTPPTLAVPTPQEVPTPTNTPVQKDTKWRPEELGFFDPLLDKSYGTGDTAMVGKDLYYRNVFLFIERIEDLARIKGDELIAANINTCLRGTALGWYTSELSTLTRNGLRISKIEQWTEQLRNRFRESTSVALTKLTSTNYTVTDARKKREPAAYVQEVLRHAKAASLDNVLHQLTYAYSNIAPELRIHLNPPNAATTIEDFVSQLELKKDAWWAFYNVTPSTSHRATSRSGQETSNHSTRSSSRYGRAYDNPSRYNEPSSSRHAWSRDRDTWKSRDNSRYRSDTPSSRPIQS